MHSLRYPFLLSHVIFLSFSGGESPVVEDNSLADDQQPCVPQNNLSTVADIPDNLSTAPDYDKLKPSIPFSTEFPHPFSIHSAPVHSNIGAVTHWLFQLDQLLYPAKLLEYCKHLFLLTNNLYLSLGTLLAAVRYSSNLTLGSFFRQLQSGTGAAKFPFSVQAFIQLWFNDSRAYTINPAGYNSTISVVSSPGNDDLCSSHFKESNVFITGQQSEGSPLLDLATRQKHSCRASQFFLQSSHAPPLPLLPPAGPGHPLLQQSQAMGVVRRSLVLRPECTKRHNAPHKSIGLIIFETSKAFPEEHLLLKPQIFLCLMWHICCEQKPPVMGWILEKKVYIRRCRRVKSEDKVSPKIKQLNSWVTSFSISVQLLLPLVAVAFYLMLSGKTSSLSSVSRL
ncbi:hypothetical protein HPP92_018907 [Vanilla planifolia]|uniref:Uncharacterized protein n=1 Tax=Vanilla planifolia TaxID=51239 RepID=A0A835QDT8_VANPL|nr:hypothetical protein HPP92_018907 [Vanilla planifolia]